MAAGLQWVCLRAPHNCLAIRGRCCLPAPHWSLAPCWTPVMYIYKLVRSEAVGRLGEWGGGVLREGRWQLDPRVLVGFIGVTEEKPQGGMGGRGRPGRQKSKRPDLPPSPIFTSVLDTHLKTKAKSSEVVQQTPPCPAPCFLSLHCPACCQLAGMLSV